MMFASIEIVITGSKLGRERLAFTLKRVETVKAKRAKAS
jgi:hypothetical protein